MAIKTPEYWKEYELIEETTAYGNKVMIPKPMQCAWELEHFRKKEMNASGYDVNQYLDGWQMRGTRVRDMLKVFWELEEKQN